MTAPPSWVPKFTFDLSHLVLPLLVLIGIAVGIWLTERRNRGDAVARAQVDSLHQVIERRDSLIIEVIRGELHVADSARTADHKTSTAAYANLDAIARRLQAAPGTAAAAGLPPTATEVLAAGQAAVSACKQEVSDCDKQKAAIQHQLDLALANDSSLKEQVKAARRLHGEKPFTKYAEGLYDLGGKYPVGVLGVKWGTRLSLIGRLEATFQTQDSLRIPIRLRVGARFEF